VECIAGRTAGTKALSRLLPRRPPKDIKVRDLREPCCALSPILDGGSPARTLYGSGAGLERATLPGPLRPLCDRHLANHELPRRNLLPNMLEFRVARLLISLPARLRHYRRPPFLMVSRTAPTPFGERGRARLPPSASPDLQGSNLTERTCPLRLSLASARDRASGARTAPF
jgi:hypothetical protein